VNTYSVTYYIPGTQTTAPTPVTTTVQAAEVLRQDGFLIFIDATPNQDQMLVVPVALNPVVTLTTLGSTS